MEYFFIASFSFIFCTLALSVLRKAAIKHNIFRGDRNIPYVGGAGIFLTLLLSLAALSFIKNITFSFHFTWILIFAFILLVAEFIDDVKDFSLKARVILELAFIVLFLSFGKGIQIYFLAPWLNYIISCIWILGVTNAFNHLDVGDGLCGGIALIISLAFLAVFLIIGNTLLSYLYLALSAALAAFLLFNLPPAKVFLGNSGSHVLGFLFATLSIYGDYATLDNISAIFLPILVLGLPILDTAYLIIIRSRKMIHPCKKSDDHIFLRYLSKGYPRKEALGDNYLLSFFLGLSGVFLILRGVDLAFMITLLAAVLGGVIMVIKARITPAAAGQS